MPWGRRSLQRRKASRTILLKRLRSWALPNFFVTVMPMRRRESRLGDWSKRIQYPALRRFGRDMRWYWERKRKRADLGNEKFTLWSAACGLRGVCGWWFDGLLQSSFFYGNRNSFCGNACLVDMYVSRHYILCLCLRRQMIAGKRVKRQEKLHFFYEATKRVERK